MFISSNKAMLGLRVDFLLAVSFDSSSMTQQRMFSSFTHLTGPQSSLGWLYAAWTMAC